MDIETELNHIQNSDAPVSIPVISNGGRLEESENETKDFKPKTSFWEALVHMFRGTVGTGIMALPYAFNQSGYMGGILGVIATTYLVNYCSVLLAICSRELAARRKNSSLLSYQATVDLAFQEGPTWTKVLGPFFVSATNFILMVTQLGGVCVYIIFISQNVKAAMDPYIGEHSVRIYTLYLAIPVFGMSMVISLKRLAFISTFGNVVLLCSVVTVMYYSARDLGSISEAKMFGSIHRLPVFFGTVFFASGCLSLVLPLQSEMRKPKEISTTFGVLNINAFLSGTLYCIFGLLGYLNYGDKSQPTVTLNLPQYDIMGKLVQIFLAVSTMTGAALSNYVAVSIIWDDYLSYKIKKNVIATQYILRVVIVVLTVGTSILVPDLELVMSAMGTLGHSTVGTIFPCIIHILTFYKQPDFLAYLRTFSIDVVVIVFSSFILISSAVSAV